MLWSFATPHRGIAEKYADLSAGNAGPSWSAIYTRSMNGGFLRVMETVPGYAVLDEHVYSLDNIPRKV